MPNDQLSRLDRGSRPTGEKLPEGTSGTRPPMLNTGIRNALDRLASTEPLTWILLGFALAYVLFFLWPVFLEGTSMQVPPTLPAISPIGTDLGQALTFLKTWLNGGPTPYVAAAKYPPLSYVLLEPLVMVPRADRYLVLTLITLMSFAIAALFFPLKVGHENRLSPVVLLVFATGLISYGLQFELERGQFDVIAVALALLAIWIFHSRPEHKLWAYVLFSVAVQLKLYPFIFILMLIGDWRDWRGSARTVSLLTLVNVGLFFVMGPRVFLDFVNAVRASSVSPDLIWIGNHSIHSFVNLAAERGATRGYTWVSANVQVWEVALLAVVALSLLFIVLKTYPLNSRRINPALLLACAIAACLIPDVSNDYKLSILAGPIAVFLADLGSTQNERRLPIHLIPAVLALSFAYAATLFPFTYKPAPLVFQNDLPALFTMLIAVLWISIWPPASSAVPRPASESGDRTGHKRDQASREGV